MSQSKFLSIEQLKERNLHALALSLLKGQETDIFPGTITKLDKKTDVTSLNELLKSLQIEYAAWRERLHYWSKWQRLAVAMTLASPIVAGVLYLMFFSWWFYFLMPGHQIWAIAAILAVLVMVGAMMIRLSSKNVQIASDKSDRIRWKALLLSNLLVIDGIEKESDLRHITKDVGSASKNILDLIIAEPYAASDKSPRT